MAELVSRMYWEARYGSASNHLHTRIMAREYILIGYIAAATTLIGIAFGSQELRRIALMLPFVALAVALILSNHENVIRQLEEHLGHLTDGIPDDWYSRVNMSEERTRGLGYRTAALLVIVGGSSIIAVLIGRSVAASDVVVWYLDIAVTIGVVLFVLLPRIRRMRQYRGWIRDSVERRGGNG